MTPTELKDWLQIGQIVITAILAFVFWLVGRDRVTTDRINKFQADVDDRMNDHATRLTKVEAAMEHVPGRDSIGKIHARLDRVQQDLAETKGELRGMHKTLDLIHSHMLEKDK